MGIFEGILTKQIRIECEGKDLVDIHDLKPLQGDLKVFTDDAYLNLKQSIIENGFSDPFTVWIAPDGTKYIHDGHERRLALLRMEQEDGFNIPLLPASYVHAKNKKDAKKKLLANDSRYGKITDDGIHNFMYEEDSPIDESEVGYIDLPEVEMGIVEDDTPEPTTSLSEPKELICPNCSHVDKKENFKEKK